MVRSYGQTKTYRVFKETEYVNGSFYRALYDTIKKVENKRIDIYFLKDVFYSPYYLPAKFLDTNFRSKTVSIWRFPERKKDLHSNWENTYVYDSLGRVTNYGYSGCFICSQIPYRYVVSYDSSGRVVEIKEIFNGMENYRFHYSDDGDIIQFDKYLVGKLETRIILIK